MQKKINYAIFILFFISLQCILLEIFERYYYQIEKKFVLSQAPSNASALYHYDAYGFRTHQVDYEHKKGYRILVVGGNSIAMGYGVPIEETFPYYLQKKLETTYPDKNMEVINVCLPGNPLPRNMARIKNIFLDKIKPDLVLYTSYLYETDLFFSGDKNMTSEGIFSYNESVFNVPQEGQGEINPFSVFRIDQTKLGKELVTHSLLAAKLITYIDLNLSKKQNKIKNNLLKDKVHVAVSGYIGELNNYLSSQNINFMIVELPRSKKNQLSREIQLISNSEKIPYLSLKEEWKEDSLNYIEHGHYASDTNKKVGEAIADWLSKNAAAVF